MSESEDEVGEGRSYGAGEEDFPHGKLLPLNSRRLTATHLKSIVDSLDLPTTGSPDQIRQLIKGKLQEERQVTNIQVVVQETSTVSVRLSLLDKNEVFHDATPYQKESVKLEPPEQEQLALKLAEIEQKNEELEAAMLQLQEQLAEQKEITKQLSEQLHTATTESPTTEIETLKTELKREKEKSKRMWKRNCEQASEQENPLAKKDEEIMELKTKLAGHRSHSRTPSIHSVASEFGDSRHLPERVGRHRGKAPPVDNFTGEDPKLRFEDWLPALERAVRWNEWSNEETLIQLAGHLHGRVLQEWNLLEDKDKENYNGAVNALKDVLGPGSKVLAVQDFQHTTQEEGESVAAFVCRLERTFRIAYSGDKLSTETRGAFLYGQLQEGLR